MAIRRKGGGRGFRRSVVEPQEKVNSAITASRVRVITEDGKQLGVMDLATALSTATEMSLDLVEVSPNTSPPVCKILDFGKFIYQKQKKQKEAKKNQKIVHIKEVKLRPNIEEGDYQVKLKNAIRFIEDGDKVKASLWYRGREMQHKELGLKIINRMVEELSEIAVVEQEAKMEGRVLQTVFAPIKK